MLSRKILKRFFWLPIFLLYLTLRLFSGYAFLAVEGDACTYLTLARHFPFHTLYNHDLYLIHPPLYGYLIGLMDLFLPLVQAGLWVSVLCFVGTFFALKKLAETFDFPPAATALVLLYFSLSKGTVVYFSTITRVPLLMLMVTLALVYWQKYLRDAPPRWPVKSFIISALALLVSEQALILFPAFVLLALASGRREQWSRAGRYLLYLLPVALLWPLIRWIVYSTQVVYPAGTDGLVEYVGTAPWQAILQPNFLPLTHFFRSYFTAADFSLQNFRLAEIFSLPFSLILLPKPWSLTLISAFLLTAFIFRESRRQSALFFVLAGIFYLPCLFSMHDWYGLPYAVPFALLLGQAVGSIVKRYPRSGLWTLGATSLVAIVVILIWVLAPFENRGTHHYRPIGGRQVLFTRQPLTRGQQFAAQILGRLPDEGFMSPVGLTPELVYLTDKRFLALPFDPGLLDGQLKAFAIKYLIFSSENLGRTADFGWDMVNSKVIADHIRRHPEKFHLETSFEESYPDVYSPATFYLYRVMD